MKLKLVRVIQEGWNVKETCKNCAEAKIHLALSWNIPKQTSLLSSGFLGMFGVLAMMKL